METAELIAPPAGLLRSQHHLEDPCSPLYVTQSLTASRALQPSFRIALTRCTWSRRIWRLRASVAAALQASARNQPFDSRIQLYGSRAEFDRFCRGHEFARSDLDDQIRQRDTYNAKHYLDPTLIMVVACESPSHLAVQ